MFPENAFTVILLSLSMFFWMFTFENLLRFLFNFNNMLTEETTEFIILSRLN